MRCQLDNRRGIFASPFAAALVSWAVISTSVAILLTFLLLQINGAEGGGVHVAGLLGSMLWVAGAVYATFLIATLATWPLASA